MSGGIAVAGWRRKALEMFPEREAMLRRGDGIHTVLVDLRGDLEQAYRREPPNHALIDRVYAFAAWCFGPRQNRDLRNAAAVSFYETLPAFAPARADLARHLTPAMWVELRPLLYQVLPPDIFDPLEAKVGAVTGDRAHTGVRRAT